MAAKKTSAKKTSAKKTSAKKIVAKKKAASTPAKKAATAAPKAKAKVTFDLATAMLGLPAGSAEKPPSMPVRTAQLEAERLWAVAKPSRPKFVALEDFPAESFDAIPHLVTALSEAETNWQRSRIQQRATGLVATRKEAEAARSTVMSAARYRLRKNAEAQVELDRIDEGQGLADLIQDLHDLAKFIEPHLTVLTRDANITAATPEAFRTWARTLSEGEGDSDAALTSMAHRNKVYAALDEALGEVRAAARYLYARDPKRLAPYLSQFEAARKRGRRKK